MLRVQNIYIVTIRNVLRLWSIWDIPIYKVYQPYNNNNNNHNNNNNNNSNNNNNKLFRGETQHLYWVLLGVRVHRGSGTLN